jgi:hypothetical protein
MIIWSRAGFLVIVILILSFVFTGFVFDAITGVDNYTLGHGLPDV